MDPFTISTGYELIKIAKREGWFQRARDLFRKKHRAILLGSTGAGKSQFIKSIPDLFSSPISQAARTEFATTHRVEISGALFDLIDTPGPKGHQSRRADAFNEALRRDLKGVINFVSYGYHEYALPISSVIKGNRVLPAYLNEHRQREIDLLSEWAPSLSSEWVVTVVTKADLWWDDRDQVAAYYREGAYANALSTLFPKAPHAVRPYSSISHLFYGKIGLAGSFEDQTRTALRNELFRVIREAIDRVGS